MNCYRAWTSPEDRLADALDAIHSEAAMEDAGSVAELGRHYANRIAALYALPLNALAEILRLLGGNPYADPTRYGIAQAIIRREDAFPCWTYTQPQARVFVLSVRPPARTADVVNAMGHPRIGGAWATADQMAKAANNVARWKGEPPWRFELQGVTEADCDRALGEELDASPF